MALDPQIAALMGSSAAPPATSGQPASAPVATQDAPGLDPQLQQLAVQAEQVANAPPAPPTGPEHLANALNVVTRHPLTTGLGMLENTAQGAIDWGGRIGGRLVDLATGTPNNRSETWGSAGDRLAAKFPLPAARELQAVGGEESSKISRTYDQLPGANTPLGQTLKSAVPEAAADVGAIAGLRGAIRPEPAFTNIGLNVGNKVGAVSPADALAALKARGVNVQKSSVVQSNTEPTLVARTSRPLTPAEGNTVATDLQQEAIAQAGRGGGDLFGPQAANWGDFNPAFFRNLQGDPLVGAQDPAIAAAARLGMRLTPEQAGGGFLARSLQSLGGSAKLERGISIKNAPQVNAAAARVAGVPQGTALSPGSLTAAKAPWNAVYSEAANTGIVDVSKLDPTLQPYVADALKAYRLPPIGADGTMDAGNLVNAVRQLRATGYANIKAQRYNPALQALGQNQVAAADALDDALDAHVQQLSQAKQLNLFGGAPTTAVRPDLMPRLLAARQHLAQIASVRQALMSDGNINAKVFAKQLGNNVPLSGDLKDIGQLADRFPRSFQPLNKIRDGGPFSVLDLFAGAEGLHKVPALLGAVAGRPILRGILESKAYQRSLMAPTTAPLGLPRAPFLRRVAPFVPYAGQQEQEWQNNPLLQDPRLGPAGL